MVIDLIVVTHGVFGVKYHFCSFFSIGHVYNKVKDTQILLNVINFTSLGSFILLKRVAVFNRHKITIFSKIKIISTN